MPHHLLSLGRLLAVLCVLLVLPTSCEKTLLLDDDSNEEGTQNGDNETPEEVGDTLTVAEFLQVEPGNVVTVKGYIVGYLASTSFSGAVFGLPTETANTNFIMADRADETNPDHCIAVKLNAGEEREALNLLDNPEYLHQYTVRSESSQVLPPKLAYTSQAGYRELKAVLRAPSIHERI